MIAVGKVKREKKDGNRGSMTVLEGHEQENYENRGGMVLLRGTEGCARSLEQETEVQKRGMIITRWLCQIFVWVFL